MKPLTLLGLVLSMFAFACSSPAEEEDAASSDTSALSSDRYCKDQFAKWRLDQARLTTIKDVTEDERALLIQMSWNSASILALTCVGIHQTRDIPADVAAHALADAQKDCDRARAAIEKQLADIDKLTADEASEAQKDQWYDAGEQRLLSQKKECEDSLKIYRKMAH